MERVGPHGLEERAPEAGVERLVQPTETVINVFAIWRLFSRGYFVESCSLYSFILYAAGALFSLQLFLFDFCKILYI